MKSLVLFLRGINVGGHHLLPMKELRGLLEELGCEDVRTYLQSGNAVLRSKLAPNSLAKKVRSAIEQAHGFAPVILPLRREEIEEAAAANPFPEAEADPKTLHLSFLARAPKKPDLERIAEMAATDERWELDGRTFYLHAPSGIARSKLASGAEKALGVELTARNWRTVQKVLELAAD